MKDQPTYKELENQIVEIKNQNQILKRQVDSLSLNEKRVSDMFNNAPLGYQSLDSEGCLLEVNEIWLKTLGYNRSEVIGNWFGDFLAPEYVKSFRERFLLLKSKGIIHSEFEIMHKNGTRRFIAIEGRISYSIDGEFNQTHCILNDITESKKSEKALKESEANLKAIIENSIESIWSIDTNYQIQYVNEVYAKDFEKSFGMTITKGVNLLESLPEVLRPIWKDRYDRALSGEQFIFYEKIDIVDPPIHIEVAMNPIIVDGKVVGASFYGKDISERKNYESQLIEANERFDMAMDASEDGLFDWNIVTNEIYYSPRWKSMLGYEYDELPNDFSIWEKLTKKEDVKKSWELQNKVINKKVDRFEMQFKMKHKDRHLVEILSRAKAIFDNNGRAIRFIGTHTDISETQQIVNKLRESELLFRKMIEHMPNGVAIYRSIDNGRDFMFLEVNKHAEQITNSSNKELIGCTLLQKFPNMINSPLINALKEVNETGKDLYLQPFYYKDDVREGWRENNIYKLPSGEIVAIFTDVTEIIEITKQLKNKNYELNKAKEKAEISEKYYHTILNNIGDPVFVKDDQHRFLLVNDAFCAMLGFTRNEIINSTLAENLPPDEMEHFLKIDKTILTQGLKNTCEEFLTIKSGSTLTVSTRKTRFIDSDGKKFIIGIIHDITRQKEIESKLKIALERALESDRLKSAFLANMSHEIRTPMNGILGFSDLLKNPKISGKQQQKYIDIIEKSGARMLNIINDIISISKIEAGLMEVSMKESNINEQIEYIYNFFKPEVEGKGMQILFRNSLPSIEATIITDSEKVYAILINIVKNAIKYSEKGSIEIGYGRKGNHLEFYVIDTGIGIPNDRKKAIFERFVQADISDKKAYQGAGLGLSISKAYVEMLDGKIWVESEEGKGSTFYFTLPYNTKAENEITSDSLKLVTQDPISIRKLKIIIAEDDEISEELISIIVKDIGNEIINTSSGVETVEMCLKNPDVDIVLMDIQMPKMDGYIATKEIRKFNKDVIIIAQTAYALEGDREKAIAAGCNDYISKPIVADELKQVIKSCLKRKRNDLYR